MEKGGKMKASLQIEPKNSLGEFFKSYNNKPYLFFVDNNKTVFAKTFDGDVVPSQVFRQWVAMDVGIPKYWDWRMYKFDKNIYKTILHIGKMLANANFSDSTPALKNIYYARGMDGLDKKEVEADYNFVDQKLRENGMFLVNHFSNKHHQHLEVNKVNAKIILQDNLHDINRADCLLVDLSIKNRMYVGCINEIHFADERGLYVILITGDNDVVEKSFSYNQMRVDKFVKNFEEALAFLMEKNSIINS